MNMNTMDIKELTIILSSVVAAFIVYVLIGV